MRLPAFPRACSTAFQSGAAAARYVCPITASATRAITLAHPICHFRRNRFITDSLLASSARLRGLLLAVRVQRVIDGHFVLEQFMIVAVHDPKSLGHRLQSPGFRGEILRGGVGAPDDEGEAEEGRISQLVLLDD